MKSVTKISARRMRNNLRRGLRSLKGIEDLKKKDQLDRLIVVQECLGQILTTLQTGISVNIKSAGFEQTTEFIPNNSKAKDFDAAYRRMFGYPIPHNKPLIIDADYEEVT